MRRVARLLPYIALLLVILVIVAFFWRAGPIRRQLKASIAQQLTRQTDRNVSIGDVSLSPTGQVVIRELAIRNKDGSALLIAPEAAVRLGRPLSLLSPSTAASSLRGITLRKPEITVIRDISRRWNIEDLLKKRPTGPSRFSGDIVIDKGRVTVVDRARGASTTIEDVDLSVQQPGPGQVSFTVHARGSDNSFDSLDASGTADSNAKTADMSGKISDLDIGYAFARLPELTFMKVLAGRANITGKLKLTPDTPPKLGAGASGDAEITGAQVEFPWLKRPLKDIKGMVRFVEGDVELDKMSGTCSNAPFEANGTVSGIQSPHLDITFKTWDLRYPELKKIMPSLLLPATLALPSPLTIEGHATGPAADPVVKGSGRIKVIKFHLVPWHDAVANFTYTKGKLRLENLHAHGSPRELNANIKVEWEKGAKPVTTASFSLVDVPLGDFAKMIGIEGVALEGTASFTGTASLDQGQMVHGRFAVKNAVTRGLRLGDITGDVDYSGQSAIVRNGRIKGPLGDGTFSASVRLPDKYTLDADFPSFDLSAVMKMLGQSQLTGRFPLTIRASGPIRGVHSSGTVALRPGLIQGRAFESMEAGFDVTLQRVLFSNISARFRQGAASGSFEIREWQRLKQEAPIAGRFTFQDLAPGAWIPPEYSLFVMGGSVSGSADISGRASDPVMTIELSAVSFTAPSVTIPAGTGRIRYQAGKFAIEKLNVTEGRTGLRIAAEATPTGTVYTVAGDQVDLRPLAAEFRRRYGLEIMGTASVQATAWGELNAPQVEFTVAAREITINGLSFDNTSISGHYANGALQIYPPATGATLRQGGSSIAVYGTLGIQPTVANDLTVDLRKVDVLTVQSLIDRANLRLSREGTRLPRRSLYFLIPRPFGGTLDASITVAGMGNELQAAATVAVRELAFGNQKVQEITGTVSAALRLEDHGTAVLQTVRLALRASQGIAYASLSGEVSSGAVMSLRFESGNVNLKLLRPWLQYVADLNGLALDGIATVNFDVGGTIDNPELRGDVLLENVTLGPMHFENALAYPITLRNRVITIERVTFSDFPMVANGTARIPLDSPQDMKADVAIQRGRFTPVQTMPQPLYFDANLYLRGKTVTLSKEPPESGMPPKDGLRDSPATGKLAIQGTAEFTHFTLADWQQNLLNVTANLNDLDLNIPGMLQGKLTGVLELKNAPVTNRLVLATPELVSVPAVAGEDTTPAGSGEISVQMRDADVYSAVADIREKSGAGITIEGELMGTVSLSRESATVDRLLEDIYDETGIFWWRSQDGEYYVSADPPPESEPIILSQSVLFTPSALPTAGGGMPFAPDIRVRLEVGEDVEFHYGAGSRPTKVKVDPGGYLYIGGLPTPEGVILDGEAHSHEGTLSFPNGTLTLRSGVAKITLSHQQEMREVAAPTASVAPGERLVAVRPAKGWGGERKAEGGAQRLPRVWISAEADGRIGDYYVSLNPIGQVYPPPPESNLPGTPGSQLGYSLNAVSIPPLDEAYVLALLAGPIITPAIGAEARDLGRLLSNPGAPGLGTQISGFTLPTLGSLSPASPQLSFAVGFQGPVQLRVGERVFRRVLVSYLSPLSGVESRALTITYEVTPRWSFGWNFNPIDKVRWEVQAFFPF